MSLAFDELLMSDHAIGSPDRLEDEVVPLPPLRPMSGSPDPQVVDTNGVYRSKFNSKSSSPASHHSGTHSSPHSPRQDHLNTSTYAGAKVQAASPTTPENAGKANDQGSDSASLHLEIDPLLESTFAEPFQPDHQGRANLSKLDPNVLLPPDLNSSPSAWFAPDPMGFAHHPQTRNSRSKSKSPTREELAKRWQIDTASRGPLSSGPPSALSDAPTSPGAGGYGLPYSPTGSGGYDFSRSNSSADLHGLSEGDHGAPSPVSTVGVKAGVPPPKKKSHARKQPEGHIKRARNAFILFRKHVTDKGLIPPSVEVKHQNISVVAAKMWREAPQEVRQKFQEQARIEKEEHQRLYPGYRYQPVFRRTDIIRRRVRKDAAEDEKVEAVAEALIKGKAGNELEKEIKEQMVQRASDVSESDTESSRPTSRRRRRDQGQLSKGAIRAQRAQARAKQMRQNLLGSNLLSMSMYNAAQQQAQQQQRAMAQSMPYGVDGGYLPVGYDVDGRPLVDAGYPVQYAAEAYGEDMYRLPPIMGYDSGPTGWDGGHVDGYYEGSGSLADVAGEYYPPTAAHAHGLPGYSSMAMGGGGMEYSLPPLELGGTGSGSAGGLGGGAEGGFDDDVGEDPRMRWTDGGQQTPSGHVVFNERLFDGALGSAGLGERRDEDGLGSFEEAVAQASELQW